MRTSVFPALHGQFVGDPPELIQHPLHGRIHPLARNGRMAMIGGKAREGGAGNILVEELKPVEAVAQEPANKILRNLPGSRHAQAAGIAGTPGIAPALFPEFLIVGPADGFLPLLLREIFFPVVSCPVMMIHPARPIRIAAHAPAAIPGELRELA